MNWQYTHNGRETTVSAILFDGDIPAGGICVSDSVTAAGAGGVGVEGDDEYKRRNAGR